MFNISTYENVCVWVYCLNLVNSCTAAYKLLNKLILGSKWICSEVSDKNHTVQGNNELNFKLYFSVDSQDGTVWRFVF